MKGLSISLRTLILTATILSVTILQASTESNIEHTNWIEYDNGKYLSIFYTPTEEGEFWVKKLEEVKSSDNMFGDIFNPAGTKYIVTTALFAGNFDSYKIIKKEFYDDDMNLLQSNDIGRNVTSDKSIFPPSVKLQYIKYLYNNESDDFINIGKVSNPKLLDFELSIFRDTKIIYVDEQHKNCYQVLYLLSYTPPAKINQRTIAHTGYNIVFSEDYKEYCCLYKVDITEDGEDITEIEWDLSDVEWTKVTPGNIVINELIRYARPVISLQYQLRKDSELFYTAEYNDDNPASYFTEEISTEWLVNEGGENRFTFIHTYPYGTSVNGKYYENVKYRIQRIDFYDNFTKQYFNEAFYYDNNGNELFSQWETKGESDSHLKREALQGEILYYKSLLYLNYDGSDLTLLRGAKESDSNAGDKGSTSETKNNQPQIAKYKIDISKGKWKEFEYGVFVNTHTEFDELGIKGCIKIDDYISEDITYDYYNLDLDEYMFITRETQGSEQEEVMEILGESVFTRCFTAIKNMYLKKLKAERDGRWIIVSGKNDFNLAIARDFNTYGNNICIEIEARLTDEALRNADPEMKQLNIRKRWMKLTFKNDNLGQIIRSEMAWVDNKGNKLYGEQSNEAIGIYDFFKQDEFTQEAIENIFAAKKSIKENLTPINVEKSYGDSYYSYIDYIDYINNNYNFDYKFKFHRYFDNLDKAVELYGHKCYRVDTEIEFNKEFTKYKILSEKHYDKNDNLIAEKRGGSGFENISKFDAPNISDCGYYYQIEAFAAESLHNIIILFYQ